MIMKLRNKIIIASVSSLILPLFSKHLYSVSYDMETFIENYSIMVGFLGFMLNGAVIALHNQLKWLKEEYDEYIKNTENENKTEKDID